jgi:protein-tyrosine phosphatase
MRILFVCLGNICRSPSAEAVMKDLCAREGIADEIYIDSAGTGDWHIGHPADPRAIEAGKKRGFTLTSIARQVQPSDFENFDLVVAMDSSNRADLIELSGAEDGIMLLRQAGGDEELDVPDPYFGDGEGFEEMFDLLERHCAALLSGIRPDRAGRRA